MKKSLKTFFAAFLSVLAFSLLSCNDVIFADIRNEVKLNDPTVSGSIQAIVRYKDDIYAATGRIYYRPSSDDSSNKWEKLDNMPDTNAKIYNLAADKNYLYAVSLSFTDDDDGYNVGDERGLWRYDGSSWTRLLTIDYSSTYFFIFCTNTPKSENRKAFFRYGSSVYDLSAIDDDDTEQTSTDNWTALSTNTGTLSDNTNYSTFSYDGTEYSVSAAYSATFLNNVGVILSPYRASTSNETKDDEATCVYTANDDDIYYSTDGSSWTSVDTDSDSIISMGFTQDFMLLGTADGIQHVTISGNVPGNSVQDFDNNAASALSSYYEVPALLVVDPSQNEYSTAIFAAAEFSGSSSSTSATLDNVGLWGYYPSEDEWNRE